jgi:hypothetical protein
MRVSFGTLLSCGVLLLIALLLLCGESSAQSVKVEGHALDFIGPPINGAKIRVLEQPGVVVTSDKTGYFEFSADVGSQVGVFQSRVVWCGGGVCVCVDLLGICSVLRCLDYISTCLVRSTSAFVCVHQCVCVCVHQCMCIHQCVCVCVCVCVDIRVCVYISAYTSMYIRVTPHPQPLSLYRSHWYSAIRSTMRRKVRQ